MTKTPVLGWMAMPPARSCCLRISGKKESLSSHRSGAFFYVILRRTSEPKWENEMVYYRHFNDGFN
jgi:hypothetical protein